MVSDFKLESKIRKSCDFCGKKIKDDWPYVMKFYKRLFSDEFLTVYEMCDDCSVKLKKFIEKLRK